MASIAAEQAILQADAFVSRLTEALSAQSAKSVRAADAEIYRKACQHLDNGKLTFRKLLGSCLAEQLAQEAESIAASSAAGTSPLEQGAMDLSLVTFEAMEQKVLMDNLGQALESANAQAIAALNLRIAHLLRREDIATERNPFRPGVFLKAFALAWSRFDLAAASHRLVLRQMRPEVFLSLAPVLDALNAALVARGILPNLADAYKLKKSAGSAPAAAADAADAAATKRRHLPIYSKLNRWLSDPRQGPAEDVGASNAGGEQGRDPALLGYLTGWQREAPQPTEADTAVLRQVSRQAPPGALTPADENAIELLTGMFDFVFREQHIPPHVKALLARLQIPLLKAALADAEFFFREDHPARRLVQAVAKSSVACDWSLARDDPLYRMIDSVVERVQREYDQQVELFDDALSDLESFIAQEEKTADDALSQAIGEALRQERTAYASELADDDVAVRLENGEVPEFVETFLERQWARVLAFAHTVEDTKPHVLRNALKAMDDLIWSLKPKHSPEERKEFLGKLPSMLSMLNAWLNVVKWDGPERVAFFSTLAERHAMLVRAAPVELSARQQLESMLDAAEKASERRLNRREMEHQAAVDEFVHQVDALEPGTWIEFLRNSGATAKFRLAWISPRRSRFAFVQRHGKEAFTLSFDELAQCFRHRRAVIIAADLVLDRAMAALVPTLET